MAEIKWIKLTVNMFDDEKIRLIQAMPEADAIIIIWIRLLTLAGKTNSDGQIFISENMPYNEEMLATLFSKPINTIRLAIETLRKFGMIDVFGDGIIFVNNWEKHQNVDGMEKIKLQNAERNRKYRERKKQQVLDFPSDNNQKERDIIVTSRDGTDIDIEEDIDIKNMSGKTDASSHKKIVDYLNQKANTSYRHTGKKTQTLINARLKDGFGEADFKKVIDIKVSQWLHDPKMSNYLRPETLFGTKFESYLNEKPFTQAIPSTNQQQEPKKPNYINELSEQDLLNMGE